MLTQQSIIDFCNQYDYDIRKTGNGRWIDQKCAADVVTLVADCIYNYALEDEDGIFTTLESHPPKSLWRNIHFYTRSTRIYSKLKTPLYLFIKRCFYILNYLIFSYLLSFFATLALSTKP